MKRTKFYVDDNKEEFKNLVIVYYSIIGSTIVIALVAIINAIRNHV